MDHKFAMLLSWWRRVFIFLPYYFTLQATLTITSMMTTIIPDRMDGRAVLFSEGSAFPPQITIHNKPHKNRLTMESAAPQEYQYGHNMTTSVTPSKY